MYQIVPSVYLVVRPAWLRGSCQHTFRFLCPNILLPLFVPIFQKFSLNLVVLYTNSGTIPNLQRSSSSLKTTSHIPHETNRFLVHKIPCQNGCTELGAHRYLMHSLFHLASYSYSIDTQVAKCCVTLSGWIRMDWQPLRLPPHPRGQRRFLFGFRPAAFLRNILSFCAFLRAHLAPITPLCHQFPPLPAFVFAAERFCPNCYSAPLLTYYSNVSYTPNHYKTSA